MTFNPSTSSFFYYSYLLPIHGYQFIAKIRELPLSLQQFPFLQVKEPSLDEFQQYWFIFKQQRATFLRNRIFQNRNGVQDVFLRGCYYARIQPENLPLFIGVPFKENIFVKAHYVEWQACFCFYLFEAGILASSVGDEQILAFVRKNPEWFADNRSILAVKRYAAFLSFLSVSLLQTSVEEKKIVDIIYCDFLAKR